MQFEEAGVLTLKLNLKLDNDEMKVVLCAVTGIQLHSHL